MGSVSVELIFMNNINNMTDMQTQPLAFGLWY
jgi:hypothetical protein